MFVITVGLSYKTAPVAVRDRLSFSGEQIAAALPRLVGLPWIGEAVLISTCNRLEIYAATSDARAGEKVLRRFLQRERELSRAEMAQYFYAYVQEEAVAHLFRVAGGTDSLVIGESQILHQLKVGFAQARAAGSTGPVLEHLFRQAFRVGKRIRTQTSIARRPVSVGSAFVEMVGTYYGDLDQRSVLLLGAGQMTQLTMKHLLSNSITDLRLTNRTSDRARGLAEAYGLRWVPWEDRYDQLAGVDIAICCTAAPDYVLRADAFRPDPARLRQRPLVLVDMSVPRNVDPAIGQIPGVHLYDIDALKTAMGRNRQARAAELQAAEALVSEALAECLRWFELQNLSPTITALYQEVEEIRHQEVARMLRKFGQQCSPEEQERLELLSRTLVKKILHRPVSHLKEDMPAAERLHHRQVLAHLFELPAPGHPSPTALSPGGRGPSKEGMPSSGPPRPLAEAQETKQRLQEEISVDRQIERIVVGSRGSKLALWQAEHVIARLREHLPHTRFEVRIIKTQGDKILDVALSRIGDKGLFTKEIEAALLAGEIDLAVHSLKDLPTALPAGLAIGAVLERADARDCLLSPGRLKLAQLPPGTVVGTSSLRRRAQLRAQRPDLEFRDVRGNVETRVQKMLKGDYGALVLAAAGLERLGQTAHLGEYLSPDVCLPAVGQGALAVEIRAGDARIGPAVGLLAHQPTLQAVTAERALLRALEGGCQVPIGAHAVAAERGWLHLQAVVADLNGETVLRDAIGGLAEDAERLGRELADELLAKGADRILAAVRAAHPDEPVALP